VISGSKNARYPVSRHASHDEPCTLQRVPELADISTSLKLLETLGKKFRFPTEKPSITKNKKLTGHAPYELVRRMRRVSCHGTASGAARRAQSVLPADAPSGPPLQLSFDASSAWAFDRHSRRLHRRHDPATERSLIPSLSQRRRHGKFHDGRRRSRKHNHYPKCRARTEITDLGRMLQRWALPSKDSKLSEITITEQIIKWRGARSDSGRIEAGTFLLPPRSPKANVTLERCRLKVISRI